MGVCVNAATQTISNRWILLAFHLLISTQFVWSQKSFTQKKLRKDPLEDSIAHYLLKKQAGQVLIFSSLWNEKVKKKKGENSLEHGQSLNILGDALRRTNQLAKADSVLNKSLQIKLKWLGESHIEVANTYFSFGHLNQKLWNFETTENYYLKALKIKTELLGNENSEVAAICYSLGNFYERFGKYADSEKYYVKSLEISEILQDEKDIKLADVYNGLGVLYLETGDFQKAEFNLVKSIDLTIKNLGDKNILLSDPYNNLGNMFEKLGSFEKARYYFLKSLQICLANYGENHSEVSDSYNNLGVNSLDSKNNKEAETYFLKSIQIKGRILGDSSYEMSDHYFNLGNFYFMIKKYNDAEKEYLRAYRITQRTFRKIRYEMSDLLNNLAAVYTELGNYKTAEQFELKSLEVLKESLGENHPQVAKHLSRLGQFYMNLEDLETSEKYYLQFQKLEIEALERYFPFLSEEEKEKYFDIETLYIEDFKLFCLHRYSTQKSISAQLFNQQLASKGILLNNAVKWRNRIKSTTDQSTIALYNEWNENQNVVLKLSQSTNIEERSGLDSIKRSTEQIEKLLSIKSESFAKLSERKKVTWKDIQGRLKPNEAAIEIIRIQKPQDRKTKNDSIEFAVQQTIYPDSVFYAFLIVKPGVEFPAMLVLKNGNDMETVHFKSYKKAIRNRAEDKNSYSFFWQSLEKQLNGIQKIYLSPDGIYHKININTLKNTQTGRYLISEKSISLVTSTKDILENPIEGIGNKEAVLVGFPEFYESDSMANHQNKEKKTLNPIPSSKEEVLKIEALLLENNWQVKGLTEKLASEENIKSMFRPKLIHFATHGFFQSDSVAGNNTLLRSGLLLSRAGTSLEGKASSNKEDGILTSAEAMNLDLDQTELVVLSACETGLGEIKNGEGVYGLQRAFKVAGSKSIIMSLWKVSDEATQELMVSFYKYWLGRQSSPQNPEKGLKGRNPNAKVALSPSLADVGNLAGETKRSAFLKAQIDLKKKYPHPFHWGAFVLVGE